MMLLSINLSNDRRCLGDGDGCPSLEEVVIGEEYVKKVEVYYCEICQRYLSRTEPVDKVLELHCRTRAHHHAVEEKQRDNIPDDSLAEEVGSFLPIDYYRCYFCAHSI